MDRAMQCDIDNILSDIHNRIEHSGESLEQIARGAGVGYSWIYKFQAGRIPNPGIQNLILLKNYLNKAA